MKSALLALIPCAYSQSGEANVNQGTEARRPTIEGPGRLAGLDLLRGIAALAVLALHVPWPADMRSPMPRGYLAVDLFFVLSGFVIAHAYQSRLGTPAQLRQFCIARLIRLYPLYGLATLLSAAAMLAYAGLGGGRESGVTVGTTAASFATAIAFLPTPPRWSIEPITVFPLVFGAWSLFWELCVNLLYGVSSRVLRPWRLALLIALGALGIGLGVLIHASAALGPVWPGAWGGGARALFSFFLGVAVFRLRRSYPAPPVPALLLALLLVAALTPETFGGWAYDVACMIGLFPLLVWLGADSVMSPRVGAAGEFLGFLSYPIYVLQAPFLFALAPISTRLPDVVTMDGLLKPLIYVTVIIAGSWLIARYFDSPVRAWLHRRFAPRAPRAQAQTAP